MTDKIIEAARQAEAYATSQTTDIVDWKAIAQERFYALARAEALEDAAKACRPFGKTGAVVAAAIRALKEQDAAIARATHKEGA